MTNSRRAPGRALTFDQHDVSGLLSIAHLISRSSGRTGVYVLHFSNGEMYVGQSLDVVGRFAEHRRRWADIERLDFVRVPALDLDQTERDLIHSQQRAGATLRNVTFARGNPAVGTDLDWLVEPSDQFSWLNDDVWLDDVLERVTDCDQRRKKRANYEQLAARPDARLILGVLNFYVQLAIPRPKATELTFWALSAMPSTNAGTWPRLAALSVNKMETLVLGHLKEDRDAIWSFVNVSRSVIEEQSGSVTKFERAYPGLFIREATYEAAGGDGLTLGFYDPVDIVNLLLDESCPMLRASRELNLRLMRKGPTFQWRGHCFDLADHVVCPLDSEEE